MGRFRARDPRQSPSAGAPTVAAFPILGARQEWVYSRKRQGLSDEELEILIRVKRGIDQGRDLDQMNLTDEELRALIIAASSLSDAEQKECERFGITAAQLKEQRELAKPAVEHLKQPYLEKHRSEIPFRNLSKKHATWFRPF